MTIKGIVSDYQQEMTQKMIDEMMSDPNLIEKYAGNKRKLKRDIKKKQKKNPIDESIIQESYAKQYLKMVCNCIYKKVDESSEDKKEKAYKSFHILFRIFGKQRCDRNYLSLHERQYDFW